MSKNILITGASSGIGKATVDLLLQKGHNVVAISRDISKLGLKDSAHLLQLNADVTDIDKTQEIVKQALGNFGSIDVLINNAGLGYFDPLDKGILAHWHQMIDVNIKGVLNYIHASLPHLIKSKGHIINLGSVASHQVFSDSGIYCATKHAVFAISESIRMDLAEKVKVTTISPGQVNTGFIEVTTNNEIRNQLKDSFKAGISPETVAKNILFAIESDAVISEIVVRPTRF